MDLCTSCAQYSQQEAEETNQAVGWCDEDGRDEIRPIYISLGRGCRGLRDVKAELWSTAGDVRVRAGDDLGRTCTEPRQGGSPFNTNYHQLLGTAEALKTALLSATSFCSPESTREAHLSSPLLMVQGRPLLCSGSWLCLPVVSKPGGDDRSDLCSAEPPRRCTWIQSLGSWSVHDWAAAP